MNKNEQLNVSFEINKFPYVTIITQCAAADIIDSVCPVCKAITKVPFANYKYTIEEKTDNSKHVKISGVKNKEINFYVMSMMKFLCKECGYNRKAR